MASLLTLTQSQPRRTLASGEALTTAGEASGGELYILEHGKLTVERGGVVIASIDQPGALVGEMAVLLGIDHSATVRAEGPAVVRVIEDAITFLERTPVVALTVATLACERLNATSALLAELKSESKGKAGEQSLLNRIFGTLTAPPPARGEWIKTHE